MCRTRRQGAGRHDDDIAAVPDVEADADAVVVVVADVAFGCLLLSLTKLCKLAGS